MAHVKFLNQYSDDSQRLIDFYKDVIGLEVAKAQGSWYAFAQSTLQFAIEPEENRTNNKQKYDANWQSPYLVQIGVDSEEEMQEILERAKKANAPVLTEFEKFSYGTVSKLVDPDNNMIELILE